jgi:hypothetical protein
LPGGHSLLGGSGGLRLLLLLNHDLLEFGLAFGDLRGD